MDVKVVTRWGWSLWSEKTTKSPSRGPKASKWKTDTTLLDSILKVEANKVLSVYLLKALGTRYGDYPIGMLLIIYWYIWTIFWLSLEHIVQIFKGASLFNWRGLKVLSRKIMPAWKEIWWVPGRYVVVKVENRSNLSNVCNLGRLIN